MPRTAGRSQGPHIGRSARGDGDQRWGGLGQRWGRDIREAGWTRLMADRLWGRGIPDPQVSGLVTGWTQEEEAEVRFGRGEWEVSGGCPGAYWPLVCPQFCPTLVPRMLPILPNPPFPPRPCFLTLISCAPRACLPLVCPLPFTHPGPPTGPGLHAPSTLGCWDTRPGMPAGAGSVSFLHALPPLLT